MVKVQHTRPAPASPPPQPSSAAAARPAPQLTNRAVADGMDAPVAARAGAVPEQLSRLRSAVEQVVSAGAGDGPWTDPEGMCLDLAARWQPRLAALGFPARIATTDPALAGGRARVDGQETFAGKFHAYVVVDGGPLGELVVDPSVRQFFDPARTKGPLPEIFVGTHSEAAALFAREPQALRVELHEDRHLGRYEPASFASLVYATGRNAALRMTLE
jgi:hypothetical protein